MRYLLLILLFLSCNPVKQVLNNKEKLAQVAEVVVRNGWCANDTTFITKSDTLVEIDTIINVDIQIDTQKVNEFVYVTKWKTRDIVKSISIHDTIKSFIVDNAHVRLLQTDSARLSVEVDEWKGKAKRRQIWLFFIIAVIAGDLYIKSKL
jgi:hypothetical protein